MKRKIVYTHPFGEIVQVMPYHGIKEADALLVRECLGRIRIELNLFGLDFDERNLVVTDEGNKPGRPRKAV